jgi:hypothetical protein
MGSPRELLAGTGVEYVDALIATPKRQALALAALTR